jgi:hypothetical protein
METILIIIVLIMIFGGGGFYWRGRGPLDIIKTGERRT